MKYPLSPAEGSTCCSDEESQIQTKNPGQADWLMLRGDLQSQWLIYWDEPEQATH